MWLKGRCQSPYVGQWDACIPLPACPYSSLARAFSTDWIAPLSLRLQRACEVTRLIHHTASFIISSLRQRTCADLSLLVTIVTVWSALMTAEERSIVESNRSRQVFLVLWQSFGTVLCSSFPEWTSLDQRVVVIVLQKINLLCVDISFGLKIKAVYKQQQQQNNE